MLASRLLHRHPSGPTPILEDVEPPVAEGKYLLDGYRVIRHHRRGPECDIYEVWSEERHCICTAKMVRPDRADSERICGHLRREGEILMECTHPHIVRAYSIHEEPRTTVILETLEGATVEYLVHHNWWRLTPPEGMCALGLHLCSAVGYLHGRRLLHLDLKPTNVVSNFGLAKVLDLNLARPPGKYNAGIGTAAYLSPEQARGGFLAGSADVWGIGAVLYEVATRHEPYPESKNGGPYGQLTRRVTLTGHARNRLPGAVANVINGCLDPNPTARPRLGELEATLDAQVR
ncbi:MAG: serine/threonine protein kinase [Nocardiaceae bacterium]|nr:serine/threonine protein kinase [Nocardiaceae bacterium]